MDAGYAQDSSDDNQSWTCAPSMVSDASFPSDYQDDGKWLLTVKYFQYCIWRYTVFFLDLLSFLFLLCFQCWSYAFCPAYALCWGLTVIFTRASSNKLSNSKAKETTLHLWCKCKLYWFILLWIYGETANFGQMASFWKWSSGSWVSNLKHLGGPNFQNGLNCYHLKKGSLQFGHWSN